MRRFVGSHDREFSSHVLLFPRFVRNTISHYAQLIAFAFGSFYHEQEMVISPGKP